MSRYTGVGGGGGVVEEEAVAPLDWRWRTFPVFFAFVAGALVMALLAGTIIGIAISWLAVLGVIFGLTHIVTRQFIARRRR